MGVAKKGRIHEVIHREIPRIMESASAGFKRKVIERGGSYVQ
jgi:hypothetical protein